jgi:hypothetical protein
MAARASNALAGADGLLLADLILAESVYVLESFYEVPRERVAELLRAAIALPAIKTLDAPALLRALEATKLTALTSPRPISSRRPKPRASARSCPSMNRSIASRPSHDKSL